MNRRQVEIFMGLVIVIIRSTTPLVSIDKNDKLDLLIVENLSVISNRDPQNHQYNNKDLSNELSAIKELVLSHNDLIQKLYDIETKMDENNQKRSISKTVRPKVSNTSHNEMYEELSNGIEATEQLNALISKCKANKKQLDQCRNVAKDYNNLTRHMTKFDKKMAKYAMGRSNQILTNRWNEIKNKCLKGNTVSVAISKEKPFDLDREELKKELFDEPHFKYREEQMRSKQTDVIS